MESNAAGGGGRGGGGGGGGGATEAQPLTVELREKTKGLHGKTDRLVQLGLFSVLDYQIYRQILLGFYYVFRTVEEEYEKHLKSSKVHPWVLHAHSPDLRRTEAFEADLVYFYGTDWKEHVSPSKPVLEYMDHIRDIAKRNPEKLVAYPATIYLGIFFGGQITRSKIIKSTHFFPSPPDKKLGGENDNGIAIFTFRENTKKDTVTAGEGGGGGVVVGEGGENTITTRNKKLDPNKVKNTLKERLNSIPGIDDRTETAMTARQAIVQEAQEIFVRNMDLMTNVQGVSKVWTRWIIRFFLYLVIVVALYQIAFNRSFGNDPNIS
ncbi:hypothetical protein BGZ65_000972 [Modicella reniformis]|uniref:Heme oxygenase n=1 Tax=Modicella reniformis TaxID=1440133 RepID=A0A9P6MA43_9FUNG|nr:hypothetical protein BGZ65_000972 [Modicella reniformis]